MAQVSIAACGACPARDAGVCGLGGEAGRRGPSRFGASVRLSPGQHMFEQDAVADHVFVVGRGRRWGGSRVDSSWFWRCLETLASLPPHELDRVGFRLYERFRPEVLDGVEDRGAKTVLDIARIRRAADWRRGL